VVAAVGGTVTFAGNVGSSGLTVSERTADGRFDLSYLHLSRISVHRGDAVSGGAAVGAVGITGRRSVAAPHLHFGVREAGSRTAYRDPLTFLSPPPSERAPRPAPVPVPVAHPVAPLAVRGPRVQALPHRVLRPHDSPVLRPLPQSSPLPHPHPRSAHAARPAPAALRGPAPSPARPSLPHAAAPKSPAPGGGINVGWLVACAGLIAAATALGRPEATRTLARRSRTRLTGLLHPLSKGG
jgi:hypothetical protein